MHARREAGSEGLPGAVPLDCVASHCDILCSVQSRRAASIWQHELGAGARIGRCCHVTVACGSGKDPCCLAWGEQRDGDLGRRRRRTGRREHQPPRHRQTLKKTLRHSTLHILPANGMGFPSGNSDLANGRQHRGKQDGNNTGLRVLRISE